MKKIVAIMAVSLMLLVSCGKAKKLTTAGLDRRNSELNGNNAAITDKTLWGTDTVKVYLSISLSVLFFVLGMVKHCYDNLDVKKN
jgi:hypothetical protein